MINRFLLTTNIWVLCFVFLFSQNTWSQLPHTLWFHSLTAQEGLSQSYNWYVYHDSEGFVWISSLSGLNRFDGIGFRQYNSIEGDSTSLLGENIYSEFFEDDKQNIWFSTPEAIHCYLRQRDHFQRFPLLDHEGQKIGGNYKVCFLEKDTFLWVGTGEAIYRFDIHRPFEEAKKVTETKYFQCKVELDANGAVRRLFAFDMAKGLKIYPIRNGETVDNEKKTDKLPVFFSDSRVIDVLPESDTRFWLITDKHGLISWNPSGKGQWRVWGKFASNPIAMTSWGDKYLILVAKGDKMFIIDKEYGTIHPVFCKFIKGDERPAQNFRGVYLDKEDNLWVSDQNQGLYFANLHKTKFLSLPKLPSTVNNNNYSYWSLKKDKEGNIWVGTSPGGIFLLNKHGQLIRQYSHQPGVPNTLPSNGVRDILPDSHGNIWAATSEGLVWFDPQSQNFHLISAEDCGNNCRILHLHETKTCRLLAVPDNDGIYELKEVKGKKRLVNLLPTDASEYQTIFEDKNGKLYCVRNWTEICVFSVENDNLVLQDSFPISGLVNGFYEDEHNEILYFATSSGLVRVDKNLPHSKPDIFTEEDGLPGNFIGELLGGLGQKLWLGTNKGLALFDGANDSIQTFSLADGAQSLEFHITAALKRSTGELWFGGSNGITIVPPDDSVKIVDNLPKVLITKININDVESNSLYCAKTGATNVTQIQQLVRPFYQNTLSFEFVATEYSDPANNKLEYRLYRANGKSYDEKWIPCPTAHGFARYAKLPPGEYVLNIRGYNSDGILNPEPRRLYIKINPPFWQTWWFKTLCLIVVAAATYAGVRAYIQNKLRIKNLKIREQRLQIEKQEALTQERNRIAGEMHDDLGGGLTSIRMLSSRVQKKIDNPDIQTQVDKIANYSQELIQKMGEIIWAMNSNFDTLENLVAYIRRYAVDFLDVSGLRYHIREPEELPDYAISGERRRNIYLAVKESLHNVVKHAGADRVSMSFEVREAQLVVQVQDDGKGIDLEKVNQFGNGLYNMRKRLLDIGGDMLVENTDGTLITFIVPLEKSTQP